MTLSEQALTFLRSGYLFASRLRKKAGVAATSHAPVSLTLLGKTSHLVRGAEGVRLFYDSSRIKRDGAMPKFIQVPLFGNGAVHTLDGEEHLVRKKAMADLAYDDARVADFADLVGDELENTHRRWIADGGTVHEDTAIAFGRAAFRWAGIPMSDEEMDTRAKQMNRLLDTFGDLKTNPIAAFERQRLNKWATGLIEQVRAGEIEAPADSVLAHIADLRGVDGELVDAEVAGVELQNLTRPTVAVGRFAAFAATALVENPEWAQRIREAADGELTGVREAVAFAQEVRRTYPFVPMLPGLLTEDTEVSGCPMKKGQRVLLDFVGTLTSPQEWDNAASFDPERFMRFDGVEDAESLEAFIPQGGADVYSGHRCPGEKIAVAALSGAVALLTRPTVEISEDVEDLTFPWTTMLTRPATGVRVHGA
ncbi:cytochrome P450 [Corynebacterium sp.]|uniref:cytochrome P450 n=1 Tax=Corynebacterium sp. TaxID=1720 RepID=UPI0026DFDBD5|nr:cytochrome P450 [Corynebacterium sp.]MDO5512106.1 cytochrome P450 [Corynebacterium sp.]